MLVKSTWVRGEDDSDRRVKRNGRYQRKYQPVASSTSAGANMLFVNVILFIVLIIAVVGFVYLLMR